MIICKNCQKKLAHPDSNFCSQECFDEYTAKQMANAIAIVAWGTPILIQKKEDK